MTVPTDLSKLSNGINSKFDKIDLKIKELIKNNRLLSLGDILFNSDDGN